MNLGCKLLEFLAICGLILMIAPFSTAQSYECAGGDSQVIFRLINYNNSHIAENDYIEGGYDIEVCFDEIFGFTYLGDPNPWTCNNDPTYPNNVIEIADDGISDPLFNAHAAVPGYVSDAYESICYGNLWCQGFRIEDNPAYDCVDFDPLKPYEVATLSMMNNAHAENATTNLFNPVGAYMICCGFAGEINEPEWQDGNGDRIEGWYADRWVWMSVETTFPEGWEITFDVWEDDIGTTEDVGTYFANVIGGQAVASFFISQEMIDGLDGFGDCGNGLEFFFEASASGIMNESYQLNVSCSEGPDTPPVAVIGGPVHLQSYFAGTELEFVALCTDAEGPIEEYAWKIEHNGVVEHTSSFESFNHSFSTNGQRTVTLTCTDSIGQTAEDQIGIVIIGSPGMIAWIDPPWHKQVVPSLDNMVFHVGNDSYMINLTSSANECDPTIECLGGECPLDTFNPPHNYTGPVACENNISIDDNFNMRGEYIDLNFTWTFRAPNIPGFTRGGFGESDGVFDFLTPSIERDDKIIELLLNYSSNGISGYDEFLERTFTLGQCIDNGYQYIFLDEDGEIDEIRSTGDPGVCAGQDRIWNTTADNCCPVGQECRDVGGYARCLASEINSCDDYTSEESCNIDEVNAVEIDPIWDIFGDCDTILPNGTEVDCYCGWIDNVCEFVRNITVLGNDPYGDDDCNVGYCRILPGPEPECIDGYMSIDPEATWFPGGDATCGDQLAAQIECEAADNPRVVPCGRLNFELGFFDSGQFVASLVVIFIIYLLIYSLRKKKE